MQQASREFAGDPASVRDARDFAGTALAGWDAGDLEWSVTQIVSELATNCVIHARTSYAVTVAMEGSVVRITVRDASPKRVQPRLYGRQATTGRGLRLVEQMSRAWGVENFSGGKLVWVEVETDVPTAATDVDALIAGFLDDDDDDVVASGPAVRDGCGSVGR